MKISKKDALLWFEFFSQLDSEQELLNKQQELVYAVYAQIEAAVEANIKRLQGEIEGLKSLGGRTFYVGDEAHFSRGCRACLTGSGLNAIRKTNKCNMHCRFCYNYGEMDEQPPIGEGMWEIGGTKFHYDDISLLLDVYGAPEAVCYVYLEPFMEIEEYYDIIRKFHSAGVYQHMYTNGTLATEANLSALADCGLDELRFDLGSTGCSDKVIDNIALAKRFIPNVGIETPMTPEFYEAFSAKREKILGSGLDFINCAELHLNANNIDNYAGENMYISRHGYISPIWSREITLKLMKQAVLENWSCAVHDCSNHTKFARDLHQGKLEGKWFGASSYGSEFEKIPYDIFLPVLRDADFAFLSEEELPHGYRVGELF